MKTTYYAAKLGGRLVIVDGDKVDLDSPAIKTFEFQHRDITGEDEIEAGRRASDAGLIAANGTADESALLTHKGYTLLERQLTGWNQLAGDSDMPISAANVRTLPGVIARRFAVDQLFGRVATSEEVAAIAKKPTPPTTDTPLTEPSASTRRKPSASG
jgi:hypothetical protein